MNIRTGILLLVGLAFGVAACHKDKEHGLDVGRVGETAQMTLAVRNNVWEHEVLLTRAAVQPEAGDFMVRLENTRAEILREWRYDELPGVINVVPGSYKIVAYYGDADVLPAFDAPYYYGEVKTTLKAGDYLDTVVNTAVATVKVALTFDESFDFDYEDYFVEVKTVGDSLHFAKDETREGYFLPGNLRMRFGLKPRGQEKYYEFYPEAIKNVKSSEFYRMTLKAQSESGALSKISIVIDSTTIDIPVDVELPSFMLPKAAPKIVFEGNVAEDGTLIALEGEEKSAMALISSAGGLTGLKIKADGVAQSQGWPAEIDLMNADEATLSDLKAKGFEWDERITTENGIKSLVWVRFNNAISHLVAPELQVAHSGLTVCATDRFGQATESKISLETHPILFSELPTEANIWAKRAEMKLKAGITNETYIEYKSPGGEWQRATMEEISREADKADYWVKNLNPNQEYVFRACIGDYKSIQEFTFKTEEAAQVPNSGFEEWYEEHLHKSSGVGGKDIYVFYPYALSDASGWWNTRNLTTTQKKTSTWYYAMFPGTIPTEKSDWMAMNHLNRFDGKSFNLSGYVGNAMEIATVGWGGNKWSTFGHSTEMTTAGALYIGGYDVNTHEEQYGHAFASRPLRVKFYYKFYSYNSETTKAYVEIKDKNGNQIGYGELKIEDTADTYKEGRILLFYSKLEKAATINIVFLSTDAENPATKDIQGDAGAFSGYGDSRHIGSILTIDEVELIYE